MACFAGRTLPDMPQPRSAYAAITRRDLETLPELANPLHHATIG
jgi:hypothetical protein